MARTTILMATYNGERYLSDQLNSFLRQSYADWDLWVSDDGSSDSTKDILNKFSVNHGTEHAVTVIDGPHQGFVYNFLNLTSVCRNDSEFFAFSDQDDIWENDKLERALKWLETIPSSIPALYCSRTEIVDENARPTSPATYSPLMKIKPSFENALVQSIAGGNTMVFNRAAKKLIDDFGGVVPVPSHDWWLYLLVSAVDGKIHYDPYSSLMYRQHEENIVGSNRSFGALFSRLNKFLDGRFKEYNDKNVYYLNNKISFISAENQQKLQSFVLARNNPGLRGLRPFKKSGAKRNGALFNLALWLGVIIGRI